MFSLHPALKADTFLIGARGISNLYLMNDSRYPWVILVPARDGLSELHDLNADEYTDVSRQIHSISTNLKTLFKADKINVGALGNMVPQLHIHLIARFKSDPAWPGPVWGHSAAVPYTDTAATELIKQLKNL